MAGSYPDAPSRRLAWDVDGTVAWGRILTLSPTELTLTIKQELNDEDGITPGSLGLVQGLGQWAWIFPELRDIVGMYLNYQQSSPSRLVEYSTDSTDGINGTFVTAIADLPGAYNSASLGIGADVYATYRTKVHTFASMLSSIRVLRLTTTYDKSGADDAQPYAIHLYGVISAAQTPDRLLFIDQVTGLEFTKPLDWGDIPRGVTIDHEIKIKNNSSTLTANTNLLDFESLYLTSDTWYTIKETGGSFATTLSIASIAPGVTYPSGANVITIRLIVAATQSLGLQVARLKLST